MNKYTIIPNKLSYKSAPAIDQEVSVSLSQQSQQITEYDRSSTISLSQVFDDERQASTIFRPTFKINFLYDNTYTGTTNYLPFQYNLYYVDPEKSMGNNVWKGFPQYYEFDFYRATISDQHVSYRAKSAYTYNWTYYISYPYKNNYDKQLSYTLNNSNLVWTASDGIPFSIKNSTQNGSNIISFQCISPHGLSDGEYVELSFKYNQINLFQVYSLGNDNLGSDVYVFNLYNVGYTGATFSNNVTGTFKRVTNPENIIETKSKYYVREHKILSNTDGVIITKNGFEKNVFNEDRKFEYSSITPNKISRISQKNSSNSYNATTNYDINIVGILDNQKRPISELFLTIINRGYTGYFNQPYNEVGLKQGWEFNLTKTSNSWWDGNNDNSNTKILTSGYTMDDKTFYYNSNLMSGDTIDGDFCEWNDYAQIERVVSPYYHKIKYNQKVFQTTSGEDTNSPGYYYEPHTPMTIRLFSDYIETGDIGFVDIVPNYSYFSNSDQQFRWRDMYSYGFMGENGGVDYPFINSSHYPFKDMIFRLIPEGINYNSDLLGYKYPVKPLIDGCE